MLRFTLISARFFTVLLIVCVYDAYANIVYVHLSAQLPPYVHVALEQARLFNPHTDIYLIANLRALDLSQDILEKSNIIAIPAEKLAPSKYHQRFNRSNTFDNKIRDGFWKKATERFFYIHELMVARALTSVVQVESDNMLYVNIAEIQSGFSHYTGIGAVFDNDHRCIPSVVYIADEQAITHLVQFIADNASTGLNDMQIIGLYHKTFPQKYVDKLPLIMPAYIKDHPLINDFMQKPINPFAFCNNIMFFNSIFDGAAIGQYLGGIDPRNGPSQPGYISDACIFNPSYFTYEWHRDEQGREVPFALFNGIRYRINNLHIHSKFLHRFRSR